MNVFFFLFFKCINNNVLLSVKTFPHKKTQERCDIQWVDHWDNWVCSCQEITWHVWQIWKRKYLENELCKSMYIFLPAVLWSRDFMHKTTHIHAWIHTCPRALQTPGFHWSTLEIFGETCWPGWVSSWWPFSRQIWTVSCGKIHKARKECEENKPTEQQIKILLFAICRLIRSLCFFMPPPPLPFLWEKNQYLLLLHRRGMVPAWSTPPSLANSLKICRVSALQNEWGCYKLHSYITGKWQKRRGSALRFYGKTWVFAVQIRMYSNVLIVTSPRDCL